MNKEAYRLANEIRTDVAEGTDRLMDSPVDMDMKSCEMMVVNEIRKEKKRGRRRFGKMTAAACAAVALVAGTAVYGGEVHAAIRQITWNIENALGLSRDLADYREVIHTSVSDHGYMVTLQEAVVSEERLAVNYTIQREDGQPLNGYPTPMETVYVNGVATVGGGGSAQYLDDTQTVLGVQMSYDIPDMDLSGQTEFRICIRELGVEETIRGNWDFAFVADGASLMADTERVDIGKEFTLPDGVVITLEELTMNDLEQRISFRKSAPTDYLIQILAEDDTGRKVEFGVRSSDAESGYMTNEEIIDDGRISDAAGGVTMTLEAVKLPEESGRISDDYVQIGESFELKL